jgi:carbon monoxide dehydrogenase subunit G
LPIFGQCPTFAAAAAQPMIHPHPAAASGAATRGVPTLYRDSIVVAASPEAVWRVLTDYERLPEFIPDLERCRLLQDSLSIRQVEQVGVAGWLFFKIHARVVLRVQERAFSRIEFCTIGGDFDVFEGWWSLLPENGGRATMLKYQIDVQPSFHYPGFLTKFLVRRGLRTRLLALQVRASAGGVGKRR